MTLDVIIPVKDRAEIRFCIQSLLDCSFPLRILVCDGGSSDFSCINALHQFRSDSSIQHIHVPMQNFNKSKLINQGILHSTAELILISDADILWNTTTLKTMVNRVDSVPRQMCYVETVAESESASIAVRRDRYTFTVQIYPDRSEVSIIPVEPSGHTTNDRPGYGLICARRHTLLALGGYKELFRGWGWEDQDLLIRAALLELPIAYAGHVIHLSHGDQQRNQFWNQVAPTTTRNHNILACLHSLSQGTVLGDLSLTAIVQPDVKPIHVHYPPQLPDWL